MITSQQVHTSGKHPMAHTEQLRDPEQVHTREEDASVWGGPVVNFSLSTITTEGVDQLWKVSVLSLNFCKGHGRVIAGETCVHLSMEETKTEIAMEEEL